MRLLDEEEASMRYSSIVVENREPFKSSDRMMW